MRPTASLSAWPSFLTLPARTAKPRSGGLTHVMDKGLTHFAMASLLDIAADHIDIVKFGWGTAYVTPHEVLKRKVALCRAANVQTSPGGTLFELAVAQGTEVAFARWCSRVGFDTVEVSEGTVGLSRRRRTQLIRDLSADFHVVAEVGCKDNRVLADPNLWAADMTEDLAAGAQYVVAEGRESGTVGVYDATGAARDDLVETILGAVPSHLVIFETPGRNQQSWFVHRIGPSVNLGNVAPDEVVGVETLRRGLRFDTASLALADHHHAAENSA